MDSNTDNTNSKIIKKYMRKCIHCFNYKHSERDFVGSNRICNACKKEELDNIRDKHLTKINNQLLVKKYDDLVNNILEVINAPENKDNQLIPKLKNIIPEKFT